MIRHGLVVVAGVLAAVAAGACGSSTPDGRATTLDGYLVGPGRSAPSGAAFHALETAARTGWMAVHPGELPVGFSLHHAASADGGSPHPVLDAPADYLMVITLKGGEQHAFPIRCDPATLPELDGCVADLTGSSLAPASVTMSGRPSTRMRA